MSYKRKYHLRDIPKGTLGDFSKVWEEYYEFVDAYEQGLNVMCLCELSDIMGALSSIYGDELYDKIPSDIVRSGTKLNVLVDLLKRCISHVEYTFKEPLIDDEVIRILCVMIGITDSIKDSMEFNDIVKFTKKTKEACNEKEGF